MDGDITYHLPLLPLLLCIYLVLVGLARLVLEPLFYIDISIYNLIICNAVHGGLFAASFGIVMFMVYYLARRSRWDNAPPGFWDFQWMNLYRIWLYGQQRLFAQYGRYGLDGRHVQVAVQYAPPTQPVNYGAMDPRMRRI